VGRAPLFMQGNGRDDRRSGRLVTSNISDTNDEDDGGVLGMQEMHDETNIPSVSGENVLVCMCDDVDVVVGMACSFAGGGVGRFDNGT
jgi:hypothetical protein